MFWQINLYCTFEKAESSWAGSSELLCWLELLIKLHCCCLLEGGWGRGMGVSATRHRGFCFVLFCFAISLFPHRVSRPAGPSPVIPTVLRKLPALAQPQTISKLHLQHLLKAKGFAFSSHVYSWTVMRVRYHPRPHRSLTFDPFVPLQASQGLTIRYGLI